MVSEAQAVANPPILPEVEETPDFLGLLAEPWAAVVPTLAHTRLVALSLAPTTPSDIPRKKRIPGSPLPFKTNMGRDVPFLPLRSVDRVSPGDVATAAKALPQCPIATAVDCFGMDSFLLQIERARDYLRGPDYWKLRPLKGSGGGYLASWLSHQAEGPFGRDFRGCVSEAAFVVAAQLDGLLLLVYPGGERVTIFR